MTDISIFSESYPEAREKFLVAASKANAEIKSYKHPTHYGPNDEPLFMDVARVGHADARNILVIGSGTHGIEGYSGSAAQSYWLNRHTPNDLDSDTAVLLFHAHNPWGFAHALRYTEEHVDLNRNFIDFSKPLPDNPGYADVHALIAYDEWNEDEVDRSFERLSELREAIGEQAFSDAFNGGQYSHSDGIFYGGIRPQWSNIVFRQALQEHLSCARNAGVIDFHTGIGPPRGHVFLCFHQPGSAAYQRALDWWGERAVNREGVTHKAVAKYQGLLVDAFVDSLPNTETTAVVVEFGTLPRTDMQRAAMAGRWLWSSSEPASSPVRTQLMKLVREAFYPSAPDWRAGVLQQATDIIDKAIAGLQRTPTTVIGE